MQMLPHCVYPEAQFTGVTHWWDVQVKYPCPLAMRQSEFVQH